MEMNNHHPQHNNWLETLIYILFSIGSYAWAHISNVDGVIFKVIIAPAIGATVGFFAVRFWKYVFPEKE